MPAVRRPLPWRLIGLDYAHLNQLRMIAPIANALEAGKPLFCGLNRPLAAPGRADDDRALTGSHNIRSETYPVNRSEFDPGRLRTLSEALYCLVRPVDLAERLLQDLGETWRHRRWCRCDFREPESGCEIVGYRRQPLTELVTDSWMRFIRISLWQGTGPLRGRRRFRRTGAGTARLSSRASGRRHWCTPLGKPVCDGALDGDRSCCSFASVSRISFKIICRLAASASISSRRRKRSRFILRIAGSSIGAPPIPNTGSADRRRAELLCPPPGRAVAAMVRPD